MDHLFCQDGKVSEPRDKLLSGSIWLPQILEKLAIKHQVTQAEVEDVFFNEPRYPLVELGRRPGEHVYSASGQTDAGSTS